MVYGNTDVSVIGNGDIDWSIRMGMDNERSFTKRDADRRVLQAGIKCFITLSEQRKGILLLHAVFVGFDHLFHRDTRTTSTPCIELFKPFFGAFARKYLNFKLRCIIIC